MYTLDARGRLLNVALLGVFAAAILGSFLQEHGLKFIGKSVVTTTEDLPGAQKNVRGQFDTGRLRLMNKYDAQIRDNDVSIARFRALRAKASNGFRKTYDARVAELERRNVALKVMLDDLRDQSAKSAD